MRSKNQTILAVDAEAATISAPIVLNISRPVTQKRLDQTDLIKYLLPKRLTIYNESASAIGYLLIDSDSELAKFQGGESFFDFVKLPAGSMMQDYNLPKSKYLLIVKFPGSVDTVDKDLLINASEFHEYAQ